MTSLEDYRWQKNEINLGFGRATSLPDGLCEIYQFQPFLPRAVRRISSDEDVQRYKDHFYIAQQNQGFTWKEYLEIICDELCQLNTRDLVTKALHGSLASSLNFENLHNTKSELELRKVKKPISRFKIAKRNAFVMTKIDEESDSVYNLEYANTNNTSYMEFSNRVVSPKDAGISHYVTALEPEIPLTKHKVTRNFPFVDTKYIGDSDGTSSMEYGNANTTSFAVLSRRQASPRKAGISHYVTPPEPELALSKYKTTRNPSFVDTKYTGDTDGTSSMEYVNANTTSFAKLSRRQASSRKAGISHYVTPPEPEFALSKHKITRTPSFVDTEYFGDTDSVTSMEYLNASSTYVAELSRRLVSPQKAGISHCATPSESEIYPSKYKVTRNPIFFKTENAGDTDSVCFMTGISTNSKSPSADISVRRKNSFSPQKNFLKKFGSEIRQFATKTKTTVGKLSKYCSELYPVCENYSGKVKASEEYSQYLLNGINFNKPVTPDMLRSNVSPTRITSTKSATPIGSFKCAVNPQFTKKVTSSYKKTFSERMLPFTH